MTPNSRSYLTQFTQPDSIIPDPYNPLDWNRYAYAKGNPINYNDPSGHKPCSNDGYSFDTCEGDELDEYYSLPDPVESEVTNPESRPAEVIRDSIINYYKLRFQIYFNYGKQAVDADGMIKDEYFIASLIYGEFGPMTGNIYNEGLEAASNQYYNETTGNNMICKGHCNMAKQITWMTDQQALYAPDFVMDQEIMLGTVDLNDYLGDAQKVMSGYSVGVDSSWNWGNVTEKELENYYIVDQIKNNVYPGKPWFIVYSGKKWQ